ncbi:MAG: hypothetical protein FWH27_14405 [Planctomycetaceae bacterium]|nr:hypothetical protein [Planctomycetaceae bacterium]
MEAEILQRGVLSPLIVWNDVLIDGHHRYAICQKHGLPFGVLSLDFDSLETAKLWAWRHQENRRNLTPYQRVEISLQFKPQLVAEAKERQIRKACGSVPQNPAGQKETRVKLAVMSDISHDTVTRVEFIAGHADESVKQKLRKGDTTINAEYKRLKKEIGQREAVVMELPQIDDQQTKLRDMYLECIGNMLENVLIADHFVGQILRTAVE